MHCNKFLERSYSRFCHFAHFWAYFREQSRFVSTIFYPRTLENIRNTFLLQISFNEQLRYTFDCSFRKILFVSKYISVSFHLCYVLTQFLLNRRVNINFRQSIDIFLKVENKKWQFFVHSS